MAKAVIWDMDGVIVDSAPCHKRAWQQVFQKRGVNFTDDDFSHNFGKRNDSIIMKILGQDTPKKEVHDVIIEKESRFRNMMMGNINPLPGAIALIKQLTECDFKIAISSSSPFENINLITCSLSIRDHFHAIVSGQEVAEGKPSPQGFLLAAQRLGVKPRHCIVIEDAVAGVTAAKDGEMHCLAVTNTHPREKLLEADRVVDTLEEINVDDLNIILDS
jgi:beta-phosphoglucomutase